ncbi:MAG TPA: peptidoglycan-binding protein [Stellaceae bacterium]|nr:peptidoglycan-binding protein [Stellaceae bacterium]
MNRTLTAAVALAIGLGMVGMAQAQTSTSPTAPSTAPSPSMTAPTPGSTAPGSMAPGSMAPGSMAPGSATTPGGSSAYQGSDSSSAMAPGGSTATRTPGSAMNPSTANAGNPAMGASKQAHMSQGTIQQAQQQLKAQGLYNGQIDGIFGPETEQALSKFQQQNGLPQTADLDQQTLDRLMSGSPSGAQTPAPQR